MVEFPGGEAAVMAGAGMAVALVSFGYVSCAYVSLAYVSWPGLARPFTTCGVCLRQRSWMGGTSVPLGEPQVRSEGAGTVLLPSRHCTDKLRGRRIMEK